MASTLIQGNTSLPTCSRCAGLRRRQSSHRWSNLHLEGNDRSPEAAPFGEGELAHRSVAPGGERRPDVGEERGRRGGPELVGPPGGADGERQRDRVVSPRRRPTWATEMSPRGCPGPAISLRESRRNSTQKHPRTRSRVKPGTTSRTSQPASPGSLSALSPGSSSTPSPGCSSALSPGSSSTPSPGCSSTPSPGCSPTPSSRRTPGSPTPADARPRSPGQARDDQRERLSRAGPPRCPPAVRPSGRTPRCAAWRDRPPRDGRRPVFRSRPGRPAAARTRPPRRSRGAVRD